MKNKIDLRTKNNELSRLLTQDHHSIITDMTVYLLVSRISDDQVELIRHDLLDMALRAQHRNVPLVEIFGVDLKVFCDEIIQNSKHQGYTEYLLNLWKSATGVIAILATLNMIFSGYIGQLFDEIITHSKINFQYPISIGFLLSTLLIMIFASTIVFWIGKNSFNTQKISNKFRLMTKPKKFALGIIAEALFVIYIMSIERLSQNTLFKMNIFLYLTFVIMLFVLYAIINRRKRNMSMN